MIDTIAKIFLDRPSENSGLAIMNYTRTNELYNIGIIIGEYLSNLYSKSILIQEEYGIIAYKLKDFRKSFYIFEGILQLSHVTEKVSTRILEYQHILIKHMEDLEIYYNREVVNRILTKQPSESPLVTLSVTACKRFDLFQKTMNSVLNCFDINMIDEWICVDDNSNETDRTHMKNLYPFFKFIWKDSSNKGHPRSMNIIRNEVKTPFLFHLEDDWKFFVRKNYIKDAIEILNTNHKYGQCLINKNYTETTNDNIVKGGIFKTTNSGKRYYIHQHVKTPEEFTEWYIKNGICLSSNYWPHFSFRPSLIRTSIFDHVGDFNETRGHFEMEYAERYEKLGYISVFFEGVYSIHIGRLTSERNDKTKTNAYTLNNEPQFVKKPLSPIKETDEVDEIDLENIGIKLKTYILNLDKRPDRWEKFKRNALKNTSFLNSERYSAVDGSALKSSRQLQRIFDGNDYNMMVGAVGCAMSYFKMFIELIYSEYDAFLFFEDDVEFIPNFDNKFLHLCKQLNKVHWDIAFLGHHIRNINDPEYKNDKMPRLYKTDVKNSFNISLGGTIGFMITKTGAKRLLDFINKHRLINCIDTIIQKSADSLNVYYCSPHLVFSECYRHDSSNENLDTDIQTNRTSLTVSLDEKINTELEYYKNNNIIFIQHEPETLIKLIQTEQELFGYCKNDISNLRALCRTHNINYFTYDEKVIFVFKTTRDIQGFFHVFKNKDEKYSIQSCLQL